MSQVQSGWDKAYSGGAGVGRLQVEVDTAPEPPPGYHTPKKEMTRYMSEVSRRQSNGKQTAKMIVSETSSVIVPLVLMKDRIEAR